jgi:UDP-2-acetamido-3-amino-2,3-dideoxy-glucuronate N-acetyltransferase
MNKNFFRHETSIVETTDIGDGTKIWAFSHISKNVRIGKNCIIGEGVYVGPNVSIGDNCKIQNHSLIYEGVEIGNYVFVGPNVITTNDIFPNVSDDWYDRFRKTFLDDGCSIGANSTILCGVRIGKNSLVGAGSVVTKSIPENVIGYGNPFTVKKNK